MFSSLFLFGATIFFVYFCFLFIKGLCLLPLLSDNSMTTNFIERAYYWRAIFQYPIFYPVHSCFNSIAELFYFTFDWLYLSLIVIYITLTNFLFYFWSNFLGVLMSNHQPVWKAGPWFEVNLRRVCKSIHLYLVKHPLVCKPFICFLVDQYLCKPRHCLLPIHHNMCKTSDKVLCEPPLDV